MPLRTYVCAPDDKKKLQKNSGIFPSDYVTPTLMWDGSGVNAADTLKTSSAGRLEKKKAPSNQPGEVNDATRARLPHDSTQLA
jgi:hypothetical protein